MTDDTRQSSSEGAIPAGEPIAAVECVETVPLDHPFNDNKTPPIWRVVVGDYVADFDYEQAARNFAGAINAATPTPPAGSQRGDDALREVMEPCPACGALPCDQAMSPTNIAEEAFRAGWQSSERGERDQLSDYDVDEAWEEYRAGVGK